jgi:integrase
VSEVSGGLHYGPPKTHQERTVVTPEPVKEILAQHLAKYVSRKPDSLVFTTEEGTHVWISSFRKNVWWPARDAAGVDRVTTIKDLRHTCASLMHAAGRSAEEIKEHLGHSTIAMTFDTYTHLFDEAGTRSPKQRLNTSINRLRSRNQPRSASFLAFPLLSSETMAKRRSPHTAGGRPA